MAKSKPWYFYLSPDAFSRYFIIKLILQEIFGVRKIKVLDVGGRDNSLWAMIKEDNLPYDLTVLDILSASKDSKNYHYIQSDALKMSFDDDSFDCVISTDVLEHIPDNYKEKFINQCLRVAKDLVIIGAPFYSQENDFSEKIANNYYKKIFGRNHKWLSEHFKANKPQKAFMENLLSKRKIKYKSFGSNNLENWLMTLLPNLLSEKTSLNRKKLMHLNSYFNSNLFELNDFGTFCYRSFYIISKKGNLDFDFTGIFKNRSDFKKILTLKEIIINIFTDEIISREKIISEVNKLVISKQQEINILSNKLSNIYNSKSYKLVSSLRRFKNLSRK